MAQIVSVINFKGGVGKTTCAIEIAVSLARHYGRRTLLVDLDPQASATFYVMEQEHWKWWRTARGTTYNLFEQTHHRPAGTHESTRTGRPAGKCRPAAQAHARR